MVHLLLGSIPSGVDTVVYYNGFVLFLTSTA